MLSYVSDNNFASCKKFKDPKSALYQNLYKKALSHCTSHPDKVYFKSFQIGLLIGHSGSCDQIG